MSESNMHDMNEHKYCENNRFTCKKCQDIFNKYGETDRQVDEMDEYHVIVPNNKRDREEEEEEDEDLSYNEYDEFQPKIIRTKNFDDMTDEEHVKAVAEIDKKNKEAFEAHPYKLARTILGGKKSRKNKKGKAKGKSKAKKSKKGKSKAKKSKKTKKRRRTLRK